MSSNVIRTLNLKEPREKILVLDTRAAPEGTTIFRMVKRGQVLSKEETPGPEHICVIKEITDKNREARLYKVTRNADGKLKQYTGAGGPKKNATKKKTKKPGAVGKPEKKKRAKKAATPKKTDHPFFAEETANMKELIKKINRLEKKLAAEDPSIQ